METVRERKHAYARLCMMAGAHRRGGLKGRWGCQLLRKPLGPDLASCNQIPVGPSFSHLAQGPPSQGGPLGPLPWEGVGTRSWWGGWGGQRGHEVGAQQGAMCWEHRPGTPVPQQLLASVSPPWGHHKATTSTSS